MGRCKHIASFKIQKVVRLSLPLAETLQTTWVTLSFGAFGIPSPNFNPTLQQIHHPFLILNLINPSVTLCFVPKDKHVFTGDPRGSASIHPAQVPLMPGSTALGSAKRGAGRGFTITLRGQLGGPTMVPENLSDPVEIGLEIAKDQSCKETLRFE